MIKKIILLVVLNCLLVGCGAIRYDRDFCGKVIDPTTNEPVAGVVVIAEWDNVTPTVAGAVGSFNKISEVVTDSSGEFCLKGYGFAFFVDYPKIEIFKAEYDNLIEAYSPNLKDPYHVNKWKGGKIAWIGNRAIIKLRKLSIEERYDRIYGKYPKGQGFDKYFSHDDRNGRKQFDIECKKEMDAVKAYQEQIKPTNNELRPIEIVPANQQ